MNSIIFKKVFVIALLFSVPVSISATESKRCSTLLSQSSKNTSNQNKRTYNPFNLVGNSVTPFEMLRQNFYQPTNKGAVVGVSGYTGRRADFGRNGADFLSGKPFADGKKVFYQSVDNIEDFFMSLFQVYLIAGPIYRLSILGHGSPGTVGIGSENLSTQWAELNQSFLAALPDDLFAKDAEIVLLSCNCSQGNTKDPDVSVNKLKYIFSKFVHNGAKIIASRQLVDGSKLDDFNKTPELDTAIEKTSEDRDWKAISIMIPIAAVLGPLLIVENLIKMFWLDEKSKFDPIDIIELPPTDKESL